MKALLFLALALGTLATQQYEANCRAQDATRHLELDKCYLMGSHPDGGAAPPQYCLRLDGLNLYGGANRAKTFTFGCGIHDTSLQFKINDDGTGCGSVEIWGQVYGGLDNGYGWSYDGVWDVHYYYHGDSVSCHLDDEKLNIYESDDHTGTISPTFDVGCSQGWHHDDDDDDNGSGFCIRAGEVFSLTPKPNNGKVLKVRPGDYGRIWGTGWNYLKNAYGRSYGGGARDWLFVLCEKPEETTSTSTSEETTSTSSSTSEETSSSTSEETTSTSSGTSEETSSSTSEETTSTSSSTSEETTSTSSSTSEETTSTSTSEETTSTSSSTSEETSSTSTSEETTSTSSSTSEETSSTTSGTEPVGCQVDPWPMCQDGDPCTLDICNDDGSCSNPPDFSQNGQTAEHCNDGNPCTVDVCMDGGCNNDADTSMEGQTCWDTGVCNNGHCVF